MHVYFVFYNLHKPAYKDTNNISHIKIQIRKKLRLNLHKTKMNLKSIVKYRKSKRKK